MKSLDTVLNGGMGTVGFVLSVIIVFIRLTATPRYESAFVNTLGQSSRLDSCVLGKWIRSLAHSPLCCVATVLRAFPLGAATGSGVWE